MPKSAKLQNIGKNDPPSGPCAATGDTIFLFETLILVSTISYLSIVKKPKWFFGGKKIQFFKIIG